MISAIRWWWSTRKCRHPLARRTSGDEIRYSGYAYRYCPDCRRYLTP